MSSCAPTWESAWEWNCCFRPKSSSRVLPRRLCPANRSLQAFSVSSPLSTASPVTSSRHIAGMTTMCSPPIAAVSSATLRAGSQAVSHWSRPRWKAVNTVPAEIFRSRALSSSASRAGSVGR